MRYNNTIYINNKKTHTYIYKKSQFIIIMVCAARTIKGKPCKRPVYRGTIYTDNQTPFCSLHNKKYIDTKNRVETIIVYLDRLLLVAR
jgi:hypothetical protein